MLDAKVDLGVIKAYIQSAQVSFNPSAADIIALKQHGVPDELVTALMQRGAEVRDQLAAQTTAPPTTPAMPAQSYPSDYAATAPSNGYSDYANYGYGYPYYSYGYPYYGYGYPYSYWNYSYPYAYYWPFYYGFYGHNHYAHYNHFNHSHGGGSFAVHGHNGFGNHSAPWAPAARGFAHGSFAGHAAFVSRPTMGARTGNFAMRAGGFAGGRSGGFAVRAGGFGGGRGGGHR
jgi:hypothetical protein